VSLRDLYDALTTGPFGGSHDPVTGLPYKISHPMTPQMLTRCTHWINHPQVLRERMCPPAGVGRFFEQSPAGAQKGR
jgi:hypothetical protein